MGIADSVNSLQILEEKEGIMELESGKQFEAGWDIEVSG